MDEKLTDREVRFVAAVERFQKATGKNPTYRDIAGMIGVAQSTAWRIGQRLSGKGVVMVDDHAHRTLEVAPKGIPYWEFRFPRETIVVVADTEESATSMLFLVTGKTGKPDSVRQRTGTIEDITSGANNLMLICRFEEEEE